MPDEKRTYRKRKRAELEAQTRLRITQSAVALHEQLGPGRTPLSAVAERAGVQRSTLYRHFPDADALLEACSAHWDAANPAPDPETWSAIADPGERLRTALDELYAWYRQAGPMLEKVFRDEPEVPKLTELVGGVRDLLAFAADVLARDRPRRRDVRAAIGHALAFSTWRSLTRDQGLSDRQATELMCRLVAAA